MVSMQPLTMEEAVQCRDWAQSRLAPKKMLMMDGVLACTKGRSWPNSPIGGGRWRGSGVHRLGRCQVPRCAFVLIGHDVQGFSAGGDHTQVNLTSRIQNVGLQFPASTPLSTSCSVYCSTSEPHPPPRSSHPGLPGWPSTHLLNRPACSSVAERRSNTGCLLCCALLVLLTVFALSQCTIRVMVTANVSPLMPLRLQPPVRRHYHISCPPFRRAPSPPDARPRASRSHWPRPPHRAMCLQRRPIHLHGSRLPDAGEKCTSHSMGPIMIALIACAVTSDKGLGQGTEKPCLLA